MVSSSRIQEVIIEILSDQQNHSVQEIKSYLLQQGVSDYTEGQFAGSINTLQRNGTIKKIDRGIYLLKKRREDMKKCFVVCPIGEEGTEIRSNSDKLFRHIIEPVCEACDFNPIRVDRLNDANSITQTIIDHLETSELVIADISGHNPNVFYEMGYRSRNKKPMIHLKKRGELLPFDITTIRALEYDLTDLDSVEEIKNRLKKTIESFTFTKSDDETFQENIKDDSTATMMPILYQILDIVTGIKNEVGKISTDTIGTIIRSMQPTQPQLSPDTAFQMQLMNGLMQNPDSLMRLMEFAEKINNSGKR